MNLFQIQGGFGIDHLKETQLPVPSPGPGQVLVQVAAASLNYRDLMTVKGQYNPKQPLPLVPLSDGAGTVRAVGPGVTRAKEGDRVMGIFAQRWLAGEPSAEARSSTLGGPSDGMLSEWICLDQQGVVMTPPHLSDEEAATLPCAAVTAWNALIAKGHVKAGDTVLLEGTGGVSIFALQFAKLSGARTILTSSSDEKLERARSLGADMTVNYKTDPDWSKRVKELTAGQGANHIIEVGGAGTLAASLGCVALGGTISAIGVLSGMAAQVDVRSIFMKGARVQGIFVGPRDTFEAMNRAIALHQLRPVVGRVFPFSEAPEALRYLESGAHFGKVVIRM